MDTGYLQIYQHIVFYSQQFPESGAHVLPLKEQLLDGVFLKLSLFLGYQERRTRPASKKTLHGGKTLLPYMMKLLYLHPKLYEPPNIEEWMVKQKIWKRGHSWEMKVPEVSTERRGLIFVLGWHRITTGVDAGISPTDVLCSFHWLELSHVTRPICMEVWKCLWRD